MAESTDKDMQTALIVAFSELVAQLIREERIDGQKYLDNIGDISRQLQTAEPSRGISLSLFTLFTAIVTRNQRPA